MKLAISNLAWEISEMDEVIPLLKQYGVKGIEIAPTKIWENPLEVNNKDIYQLRSKLENHGLSVVSLQSLLYKQEKLVIFGNDSSRNELIKYLNVIFNIAYDIGANVIVFGSPKNRKLGNRSKSEAYEIASDFFRSIANYAQRLGIEICIETNPKEYDCDFLTTFQETLEFVKKVDHASVKLNIDTGAIILNQEDPSEILINCFDYIGHVHISEPYLKLIGNSQESIRYHRKIALMLVKNKYHGWVSIEMKNGLFDKNIVAIKNALEETIKLYPINN